MACPRVQAPPCAPISTGSTTTTSRAMPSSGNRSRGAFTSTKTTGRFSSTEPDHAVTAVRTVTTPTAAPPPAAGSAPPAPLRLQDCCCSMSGGYRSELSRSLHPTEIRERASPPRQRSSRHYGTRAAGYGPTLRDPRSPIRFRPAGARHHQTPLHDRHDRHRKWRRRVHLWPESVGSPHPTLQKRYESDPHQE